MTIDELIERLEEYRDMLGGGAEVRLMTQQNWPFENEIVGLASGEEMNAAGDAAAERDADVADECVVFIVEGQQRCYGSKRAWEVGRRLMLVWPPDEFEMVDSGETSAS